MELQAGLVEGRWTPHAAKQATVSHLTPGEGEELFQMFGGLKPSKSSLDRLPKSLANVGSGSGLSSRTSCSPGACAGGSGEHGGIAGRSDGTDEKRPATN